MQRDWDLVRLILLKIEELPNTGSVLRATQVPDYDADVVSYHIYLMKEAGLIRATCSEALNAPMQCTARGMTWEGHELLDKIRSDTAWQRTLAILREKGAELSLDAIKLAASEALRRLF